MAKRSANDTAKIKQIKEALQANAQKFWDSWRKPMLQSKLLRPYYPALSRLGISGNEIISELEESRNIASELSPRTGHKYIFPRSAVKELGKDGILEAVILAEGQ